MTASKLAKEHGFRTLKEVAWLFGVTTACLRNWHNEQPEKFKMVLLGCKAYKELL